MLIFMKNTHISLEKKRHSDFICLECFRTVFEPRAEETTLPVHVVDPIETVGLQPTSDGAENKKVRLINHYYFHIIIPISYFFTRIQLHAFITVYQFKTVLFLIRANYNSITY